MPERAFGRADDCPHHAVTAEARRLETRRRRQTSARPYSRREIRAHNYKYEARMIKKPREQQPDR